MLSDLTRSPRNICAARLRTAGRLASVTGAASQRFAYNYTEGRPALIDTVAGPVHTVANTWETPRNVLDIKQNQLNSAGANDPSVRLFDYTVNNIGRRTQVRTLGSAFASASADWDWSYDTLGQLTHATHQSVAARNRAYTYDDIGNRQTAAKGTDTLAYQSNPLNQCTAITEGGATSNPVHDADGNLTDDAANTYAWDAENRLASITRKSDNAVIATYTYDASSRLIRRQAGSDDTLHLYDGWNRIADYANGSAPSLRKTYLWGLDMSGSLQGAGGVGGLLSQSLVSGGQASAVFYPTYDGNGNISEYLDGNGAVAAHFEGCDQRGSILDKHEVFARRADSVTKWRCRQYDPFGNTVVNTDTSHQFAYRFSTKPQDATTGCYYYGYRYYDPTTGRWLSRDPLGEMGGQNLYAMAGNDPVNASDYLGLAKYKFNKKKCELKVTLTWALEFQKEDNGHKWGWGEKSQWKAAAEAVVENYFNNLNYKCMPSSSTCCTCKDGVTVKFDLRYKEFFTFWRKKDWDVSVSPDPSHGSYVTPGAGTGNFDKGDVNPQNKGASQPQVPIVHETGHMLGLPHPGQDQSPPAAPNSPADYSADTDALMGAGMSLRIHNFDRAFCDQISTGDSNCDPWKGQTK